MTHDGDSGEPPPGGSPTPNARSHRLGTPPRPAPTNNKDEAHAKDPTLCERRKGWGTRKIQGKRKTGGMKPAATQVESTNRLTCVRRERGNYSSSSKKSSSVALAASASDGQSSK